MYGFATSQGLAEKIRKNPLYPAIERDTAKTCSLLSSAHPQTKYRSFLGPPEHTMVQEM